MYDHKILVIVVLSSLEDYRLYDYARSTSKC